MKLFRAFRSKKSPPPQMADADLALIEAFAAGDETKRHAAIEAHRRNIATVGIRGNAHQAFMAEVDNPSPDLALRTSYRTQVLALGRSR